LAERDEVIARGREAWPELARLADKAGFERLLDGAELTYAADRYLAAACAAKVDAALAAFEARYFAKMPEYLRRVDDSVGFRDEVAGVLRELLFVKNKIAEYSGHGPLDGWLRVVTVRLALRLKRNGREVPAGGGSSVGGAATPDPEGEYLRRRYRPQLQAALEAALAELPADQRTALKLYYLEGLTLEQIAAVLKVHSSTVWRRLQAVHGGLLDDLRRRIAGELGAGAGEVDSLVRLVDSQLQLSLRRLLADA
jgi:RNA polymerase sigma-70 factor (ECF subfamily)